LPRPIVGFFGAINERLDADLLTGLAERMPEASIVLVGPIYRRFGGLREAPNVHSTGLKPYAELPRYLAAFDCAIVPYRLDAGIEFVQPVKILEYLAGGKPVVSTAIPDVAALYSDTVRIARGGPEDFVRQVREALAEGSARRDEYMAVARRRSWEDMARDFEDSFEEALKRRRNAPRRVVHLIHGTHLGGAEEMAANLCGALSPDRYQGRVVCLGEGETVKARLDQRGVAWDKAAMRSKTDLAVVLRLIERLRAARVDLLHTHTSRTNLVGRLASRLTALPVVSTVHTAVARDINDFGRSNRVNAWIERLTRGWSACFVSVSRRNARELVDRGMDPARVVHIPNGVEIDTRAAAPEETKRLAREAMGVDLRAVRVVGILASLRPRKGAEYLLRAVAQLASEFPRIRLLVVGSAEWVESVDYLQTLKDLATDLGIAERVTFTGHRDDAAAMLSLMEVYVLPSLYGEGLPLSILEAMAQGKPVVATATEGNDELVRDGETGLLVPPGDATALAQAVATLLRDPARARAMGKRGRELVRTHFSIAQMARRYEAVYDRVLETTGAE
ncbi:MAG TPA: glycosyltransferase, partial [Sumerlaeia bacterium]|nr:glycosyltransferase [Sumerlaeia bacterium]